MIFDTETGVNLSGKWRSAALRNKPREEEGEKQEDNHRERLWGGKLIGKHALMGKEAQGKTVLLHPLGADQVPVPPQLPARLLICNSLPS